MTEIIKIRRQLGRLSPTDRQVVYAVFNMAAKVLMYRLHRKKRIHKEQNRNKKKKPAPFSLKRRDITTVLGLVDFHIKYNKETSLAKYPHVGIRQFNEGEALKFFDKFIRGTACDVYDREVIIPTEAIRFLYKDPLTDRHEVHRLNFRPTRAKRLSWIRATIEKSKEIYERRERRWSTFLYVGTFIVPYIKDGNSEEVRNYFVVVCRKEAKKPLTFITAYSFRNHSQLLKLIEPRTPYKKD